MSSLALLGTDDGAPTNRAYAPMAADFDIPKSAGGLVESSDAESVIQGRVIGAWPARDYWPEGMAGVKRAHISTIYLRVDVVRSSSEDYDVGEIINIEVFGGPQNDPSSIEFPDRVMTFLLRDRYFPLQLSRRDLAADPPRGEVVAAAGLTNGLYSEGGQVVSLLSGRAGLLGKTAVTGDGLFAEVKEELSARSR